MRNRHPIAAWWYVLLLGLANALSFLDRSFLSLVLEPVRREFDLSDTDMGLLVGPAFVLFYSFVALPIGAWADWGNRKRIVLAGLFCWTLCTGLFGVLPGFALLAAARMGVGLGEAALVPASVSIISDYFPRPLLGRALGVFTGLGTLGTGLALVAGGLVLRGLASSELRGLPILGQLEPWQAAFIIIAAPGVLLGLIIALTLREPPRALDRESRANAGVGWGHTFGQLAAYPRATVVLVLGFALISVPLGTAQWLPAFFGREYGWSPAEIGPYLGATQLAVGVTGIMTGGALADRLRRTGREDANVILAVWALWIALPCQVLIPNAGNPWLSLVLLVPGNFCLMMCYGAATPALTLVVPAAIRSKFVALYLLLGNLVGIGLGPVLVPLLTDHVFHDRAGLRYPLTVVPGLFLAAAIVLLGVARRPFLVRVEALKVAPAGNHPNPGTGANLVGSGT